MPIYRAARVAVCVLLAVISLASCGTPGAPPPTRSPIVTQRPAAATPVPVEPTTLVWSFWGDAKEVEINERIIAAFEAVHPEIRIETRHQPWSAYFQWLGQQWAQGQSPDVMFINNVPIYARTGQLENLEAYIARDRFQIDDFYPTLMETFRYQSGLYGLPRDNDTKVVYYNRRLLQAAGIAAPSTSWTWAEFRDAARKLTLRDGSGQITQYGFAYEVKSWWRIWVWQNGGDILDDHFAPTRVRLTEPAAIEAIQFLADLTNQDKVTPPYENLNNADQRNLFREGKVAMILDNHTFVPSLAEMSGLEWDVMPLPHGIKRANLAGGAGYAIASTSQHKDEAWTFLKFLTGPEGQALFAEAGVAVPARRSIRQENIFFRQQPYSVRVFFEETEYGVQNYYFPLANEMNDMLDEALAPVFYGREPAAAAVARTAPLLEDLVARAGSAPTKTKP